MRNPEDDNGDKSVRGLDRRDFGRILVAGMSGLAVGSLIWAETPVPAGTLCMTGNIPDAHPTLYHNGQALDGETTVDVVIVGAGLSGLIAARALR